MTFCESGIDIAISLGKHAVIVQQQQISGVMNGNTCTFPVALTRERNGRFVVRFPDLPEVSADGATEEEALREARDCLSEALTNRIDDNGPVPNPSRPKNGQRAVAPDKWVALRVSLERYVRHRSAW